MGRKGDYTGIRGLHADHAVEKVKPNVGKGQDILVGQQQAVGDLLDLYHNAGYLLDNFEPVKNIKRIQKCQDGKRKCKIEKQVGNIPAPQAHQGRRALQEKEGKAACRAAGFFYFFVSFFVLFPFS